MRHCTPAWATEQASINNNDDNNNKTKQTKNKNKHRREAHKGDCNGRDVVVRVGGAGEPAKGEEFERAEGGRKADEAKPGISFGSDNGVTLAGAASAVTGVGSESVVG